MSTSKPFVIVACDFHICDGAPYSHGRRMQLLEHRKSVINYLRMLEMESSRDLDSTHRADLVILVCSATCRTCMLQTFERAREAQPNSRIVMVNCEGPYVPTPTIDDDPLATITTPSRLEGIIQELLEV